METFGPGTRKPLRREVPWDRIRLQWSLNTQSTRKIAAEHGVSHTLVNRRARDEGWQRDLAVRVRLATHDMVARHAHAACGELPVDIAKNDQPISVVEGVDEDLIVATEAKRRASVALSHRVDLSRLRRQMQDLLAEIEALTLVPGAGSCTPSKPRSRGCGQEGSQTGNEVHHGVGLSGRVDMVKKLAEIMKTLIGLEREAYDLNGSTVADANPLADLLMSIKRSALPVVYDVESDIHAL